MQNANNQIFRNSSFSPARRLSSGIGVVVTGGPLSPERTEMGFKAIKSLGYTYSSPLSPSQYYGDYSHGFANGSVRERLKAALDILGDDKFDVLLASRGASGAYEIVPGFPYESFRNEKKLLIGQSDVTCLLVQMPGRAGIPAIHGSTLGAEFADYEKSIEARESVDTLVKLISDPSYRYELSGRQIKNGTSSEGYIIAGNLSMLVSLMGTPWDVCYGGSILVLEEVGEAPFRVQRMLMQMLYGGKLGDLKGLCFGRFSRCESKAGPTVNDVIKGFVGENLQKFDYPILTDLPVGHWGKSLPLPVGCMAVVRDENLQVLESPIE
ncbi:MAG TPA: LD-carboxypeptidase [Oligoflexia bacterium]|nr:LD-carboxypeptidase [Oligoflexia bacterium]